MVDLSESIRRASTLTSGGRRAVVNSGGGPLHVRGRIMFCDWRCDCGAPHRAQWCSHCDETVFSPPLGTNCRMRRTARST